MKDERLYLIHVLDCIRRIEIYAAGSEDRFRADQMAQDAILRNLQMMAESVRRLPEEMKALRTDVDWKGIAGIRNILVHDYLGIDLAEVWGIN